MLDDITFRIKRDFERKGMKCSKLVLKFCVDSSSYGYWFRDTRDHDFFHVDAVSCMNYFDPYFVQNVRWNDSNAILMEI